MRRLIWLPVAGFLLIAGAAAAAAAPAVITRVQAIVPAAAASPDPSAAPGVVLNHEKDGLLDEVLADLVANATITQAQADAITGAIADKVEAKRAELEALRQKWQEFIADGVITQDEIDQLPADNPLRQAWDSIAQDGQVTLDQLRGFGPFGGFGHHGPGGPGVRFHGEWPAPTPGS
jgi:membrane-bound lytic murein transglycosylase B